MSGSNIDFVLKANQQAVDLSNIAMRTLILVNGGAAVAMLAFIGSLVGDNSLTSSNDIAELTTPLLWFGWGVGMAAFTMFFAYFTNYATAEHATVVDTDDAQSKRYGILKVAMHVAAMLSAFSSLALFILGMYRVTGAIIEVFG